MLSAKVHLWVEYHRNASGVHAVCGIADSPTMRVSRRAEKVTCLRCKSARPVSVEPTINRKESPDA